jgi:hypothetical protein
MKRRKRIAFLVGGLGCFGAFLVCAYAIAVGRNCHEAWNVSRGSFRYRLCGVSSELIAHIPVEGATAPPAYSWRLADGTKPGHSMVRYESHERPDVLHARVVEFLKGRGFGYRRRDKEHEWWGESRTEVGLAVKSAGARSEVEVLHATGMD